MNVKLYGLFLYCIFLTVSANAQSFLKVDEAQIKASFINNQLQANLIIENSTQNLNAAVKLEILDTEDKILGASETLQNIKPGRQALSIAFAFSHQEDTTNLLWKRLRYTITPENSDASLSNIVSFSEIIPEAFELQVSAPKNIFAGMNLRAHVLATHPITGKPIKNVEITGELEIDLDTAADEDELTVKAKGKTNAEGFTTLDFQIPANIKLDDCCSVLRIKGEKNGISREARDDFEISARSFIYLNTDKPIYQPSQKLFVRGLYLNELKRPLVDKELKYEIKDERNNTVYEGKAKTSRFGVMNVEWQIPEGSKLGTYRINIYGDNTTSTAEFKVSRYDLPNLKISAKTDKPFYLPEEKTAEISINVAYLFGRPVPNGKVKIVQEKERQWNYYNQRYDTEEGGAYEGFTDPEGDFIAKVDLSDAQKDLQSERWKRFTDLRFAVYFTDRTTNRTEQKRFDVRLTKEPIHIYFIRQDTFPNPKVPYPFYISAFYADGTPAKCDLKIEGIYTNTDVVKNIAEGKTNSYGAGKFEVFVPEAAIPGAGRLYAFRVSADDQKGGHGTFIESLYFSRSEKQIYVSTNKTIYSPGNSIEAKIFSSETDKNVFINLVKNSNVVYSKQLKLKNGRAGLSIPFRPDFKGELTIAAYTGDQTGGGNYLAYSKTILYPAPDNLNLNIKSLKDSYRPNEDAQISFNAQNNEQKARQAALGVVVLDKAIEERALTEQLPDNFNAIRKLLGTADVFGNLKRRDLDNLDLSKPLSAELQLAAEFLLAGKSYEPNFLSTDTYQDNFGWVYKEYFQKKLRPIDNLLKNYQEKFSEFPKDEISFRRILTANGVNFDELRDAWNSHFQTKCFADRDFNYMHLISAGADKKFGTEDDFIAGEFKFEWFKRQRDKVAVILNNYLRSGKAVPQTEEEIKSIWKESGIDWDLLRDGWNHPLYLSSFKFERQTQKTSVETVSAPDGEKQQLLKVRNVKQQVVAFRIISVGGDGIKENYDDFGLAEFTVVLSEKDLSAGQVLMTVSKDQIFGTRGAVGGIIINSSGTELAGIDVTVVNQDSNESVSVKSGKNGEFFVANLPSGRYTIKAEYYGARNAVVENIVIAPMKLTNLEIILSYGGISETVEVTSTNFLSLASVNTQVSGDKSEPMPIARRAENSKDTLNFTPRVREYFPETLVWQPEIITNKNGNAILDFKLGDNLTTWKLYAVGSTETGEIGLIEKEFKTFQPFFAELNPPRILTEGDRIALPVPVRNYTDKSRKVAISMAENNWSKNLNGAVQNIEIAPNSTANAIFNFQATVPVTDGKQKVTALANTDADAIEKPVTVRANGREIIQTQANTFEKEAVFDINFPANAFPNTRRAEIKIYPNMLTHVAEAVAGLLQRPHGCGEQTTSSTYPNLLILKIEKDLKKYIDPKLKAQAHDYLEEGYKRLLNYQTSSGGFSYWGQSDPPNIALTAYILRFLHDAKDYTKVDETVISRAETWLLSKQNADGSWESDKESRTTVYVLHSLSLMAEADVSKRKALQSGIEFLQKHFSEIDNAFVLANLALAAQENGDLETSRKSIEKLRNISLPNKESMYWTTPNTPFYGWGLPASIETTALVLQAFLKYHDETDNERIARGLGFLMKNKDKFGVWYSTQTTVNVLNTFVLLQKMRIGTEKSGDEKTEIFINGVKAQEISVMSDDLKKPIIFDASPFLTRDNNHVEIKTSDNLSLTMAQIVSNHYLDWNDIKEDSRYFDLKVNFDKLQAKIGDEITCSVWALKKFNQNGMILSEIGLPPGADVDRTSLEKAKSAGRISNYDVLPDKLVFYAWVGVVPLEFSFKFRPRFGLNAQTAPSLIYDYYNEEASAMLAPQRFEVK